MTGTHTYSPCLMPSPPPPSFTAVNRTQLSIVQQQLILSYICVVDTSIYSEDIGRIYALHFDCNIEDIIIYRCGYPVEYIPTYCTYTYICIQLTTFPLNLQSIIYSTVNDIYLGIYKVGTYRVTKMR